MAIDMTYEEFEKEFYNNYYPSMKNLRQDFRIGQGYMCFLAIKNKKLYSIITYLKNEIDPFYTDSKLDNCREWVKNAW